MNINKNKKATMKTSYPASHCEKHDCISINRSKVKLSRRYGDVIEDKQQNAEIKRFLMENQQVKERLRTKYMQGKVGYIRTDS